MDLFNDKEYLPNLHHVCVVVKDVDKAMEMFNLLFGEKNWEVLEYAGSAEDSPVNESFNLRYAQCKLGKSGTILELMQPVTHGGAWSHFLDEHGEGIHHICFTTATYEEDVAKLKKQGSKIIAGGVWKGIQWCYFKLDPTGAVVEIIDEIQLKANS